MKEYRKYRERIPCTAGIGGGAGTGTGPAMHAASGVVTHRDTRPARPASTMTQTSASASLCRIAPTHEAHPCQILWQALEGLCMSARKCIIKQRFAWARGLVRGHSESSSMPAVCFKPDFFGRRDALAATTEGRLCHHMKRHFSVLYALQT